MRGLSRLRRLVYVGFGAAAVVALVTAGVALGANPGKEKVAPTPAGEALAKAEVLRRADFVGSIWSGGAKKPDLSSSVGTCSSYQPKQSDLVVIGAAETLWKAPGFVIDDTAEVLKTSAMVQRDWQRSIVAPQALSCQRQGFAQAFGAKAKLLSYRHVAFPRVASDTRAFRGILAVDTTRGTIRMEFEFIALAWGRSEIALGLTGPAASHAALRAMEQRAALALASRMRP